MPVRKLAKQTAASNNTMNSKRITFPVYLRFLLILLICLTALPLLAEEQLSPWVNQSQFAPQDKKSDVPIIVTTVVVISVLVISFISYNVLSSVYWDRGIFPPFLLNREVNRYEAITHIAVNIIRHDFDGRSEKIRRLQSYLSGNYPEIEGTVYHSYKAAFYDPLTTKSTAKWLSKRMKAMPEKERLFDLMFRIAVLDGGLGQKEYQELQIFCEQMGLATQLLSDKINAFQQEVNERMQEERNRKEHIEIRNSNYQKNKYLFCLGLSEAFTDSDLKKAYRKWAKMCHPDMVKNGSEAEKAASEQRFLEIQEAYEYLLQLKTAER